jgi:hypothetical protein
VNILTGNDLETGDVVWWTGERWSRHIADAVDVGDHGESIRAVEEGARRVNAAYVVEATLTDGAPRPDHIKDRIRARGPTVRPDLAIKPADPSVGNWVI